MWFWADGSPNYFNQRIVYQNTDLQDKCIVISIHDASFHIIKCSYHYLLNWALCEKEVDKNSSEITLTQKVTFATASTRLYEPYHKCTREHYVHSHLSCDSLSGCDTLTAPTHCQVMFGVSSVSIEMFECEESGERVHFTQVCDYRHDCAHGEDETRCIHPIRLTEGGFRYLKMKLEMAVNYYPSTHPQMRHILSSADSVACAATCRIQKEA